ncbi:MAG: hypothetical protein JO353_03240 [Phycisphaerae bacterium]|nr:hypothetical protein [Phycisphaerae bacterium]
MRHRRERPAPRDLQVHQLTLRRVLPIESARDTSNPFARLGDVPSVQSPVLNHPLINL